jgi:hypothetical protein
MTVKLVFLSLEQNFVSSSRAEYRVDREKQNYPNLYDSKNDRRSHLKFGDNEGKYVTTSMDQNKLVENQRGGSVKMELDPNIKADLRSSHFTLGHAPTTYSSISNSQFYDKSKMIYKKEGESNLGFALRQQNYSMGDTKLDYKTENQLKFEKQEQRPEHR